MATKGRWFRFFRPDRGVQIEAGHVAQVPLVLEGKIGSAQTGDLMQCRDGNHLTEQVVFNINQDGQLEAGARFTVTYHIVTASVDAHIWTCPVGRTARVLGISEIHITTDAGETLMVTKAEGTEAPTSGQDLLTGTFDLASTANTVVNGTLTATDADRVFAAGDRLALDFGGSLDSADGAVTIDMVYES